jgi:hypothetical protein
MEQGYREQPPTDDQHGVGHLRRATVHNQVDDKRKAEERSDDQRSRNGFGSSLMLWHASKRTQQYDRGAYSSSSIDVLQLEGVVSRVIHAA